MAGVGLSCRVRNYIRIQLKAKHLNEMMGRTERERIRTCRMYGRKQKNEISNDVQTTWVKMTGSPMKI
jgi:hypothetical protein